MNQPRLLALAVSAALAAGALFLATARTAGRAAAPAAVRTVLAAGHPSFAPGRTLALMRAVIPPGAVFAPHRHPGMQAAYVESGTLRYTVYRGSVKVYRGQADGSQKLVRTIAAGETGSVDAGDWIVETPTLWHRGGNPGGKRVVVLIAALLRSNQPVAIPVKP